MTSRTGSLTNFNGEPKDEGLVLCFDVRGDPDELLGESGGVLPAENMEGTALFPKTLALKEFPEAVMGIPAFASSIKDFTYINTKQQKKRKKFTNTRNCIFIQSIFISTINILVSIQQLA